MNENLRKNRLVSGLVLIAALFVFPSSVSPGEALGAAKGTITIKGRVKTRGATSQRDLILYLEPKKDGARALSLSPKEHTVNQENLNFLPHVLPITKGSSITFSNEDNVVHNVFSSSDCCTFDKDMEKGQLVTTRFDRPGVATIVCRIHPEMSLYVVVLETPYYTAATIKRTTVDGKKVYQASYELAGVAPGEYTLKAWNKRLKIPDQPISIQAGVATTLDFELKK